ncbi:FAD-dependent monooxygenase [Haloactinomyces albus]|uniref:Salicylate hydroxylase n=1 Tax=Haloactinomyces albus TaxID=1352928 RepID=A0AAE4CPR2_9ACTN|nr:FAD-dependent monooxygenase [Haloactinomyces albus]MDR7301978.1 salicylate hydroxylase [Haloactinomyces albus]
MRNNEMRIAIVGAGIAGLTAASALARAGVRCEVFEQTRLLREVGAGIQIAPNAANLLHRLGLANDLGEVAIRAEALEMRRWQDGSVLRRMPLGGRSEEFFGAPYYVVHRADLHHVLLESLPVETVRLGKRCVAIEESPEHVELFFEDGTTRVADVVVGADGIHSVVRGNLVADAPRFSGQTIYRGVIPAERMPLFDDDPRVLMWLGPNRHCVCYPISGGKQISFAATAPATDRGVESWSAEGDVAELLGAYDGWHEQVRHIIEAAPTVGRWALHDRDTAESWSTRRSTIMGDAAHPMLPFMAQGANQAIEDAMALAACLEQASPHTTAEALLHYAEVRKDRTNQVHRISRDNTEMLHLPDGTEQRHRDRVLSENADPRSRAWLYGYDAESAVKDNPAGLASAPSNP